MFKILSSSITGNRIPIFSAEKNGCSFVLLGEGLSETKHIVSV